MPPPICPFTVSIVSVPRVGGGHSSRTQCSSGLYSASGRKKEPRFAWDPESCSAERLHGDPRALQAEGREDTAC